MGLQSKLATVDVLDEQVLTALFDRKYIAVRVPRFYNPVYAKALSELLYKEIDSAVAAGIYESNVASYWSVAQDNERRERYLNAALPLQRRLRRKQAAIPVPPISSATCSCLAPGLVVTRRHSVRLTSA